MRHLELTTFQSQRACGRLSKRAVNEEISEGYDDDSDKSGTQHESYSAYYHFFRVVVKTFCDLHLVNGKTTSLSQLNVGK